MAKINHVIINRLGYNRKWDMTWAEKGLIYKTALIRDYMLINIIKAYFVQYSTPLFTHKFLRNKKGDGKNKSAKKNIINNQFIDMNMNYSHLDIRRNPYLGLNCYFMDSLIEEWRQQYNNRIPKTAMYYMRDRIARKRAILKASPKAYRHIKPLFPKLIKKKLLSKQQRLFRKRKKFLQRKRIAKNMRKFSIGVQPYDKPKLTKTFADLANKIQKIRFKKRVVYLPTNEDKRVKRNVFRRRKGKPFKLIWIRRRLKNNCIRVKFKKVRKKYNVKKKFPKLFSLYLGEKLMALKKKLKKRFKFKNKTFNNKPKLKRVKQKLKITFTLSPKVAKNSLIKQQFLNLKQVKTKFSRGFKKTSLIFQKKMESKNVVSNAMKLHLIMFLFIVVLGFTCKQHSNLIQLRKKKLLVLKVKNKLQYNKKKLMFKRLIKKPLVNIGIMDNKYSEIKKQMTNLRAIYGLKEKSKKTKRKQKLRLRLKKTKKLTKKEKIKRRIFKRYYKKIRPQLMYKPKKRTPYQNLLRAISGQRYYEPQFTGRKRKHKKIQRATRRYPLFMFDSLLRNRRTFFISPTENLFSLLLVLLTVFTLCPFMDEHVLSFFILNFKQTIDQLFVLPFYIVTTKFLKGLNLLHIRQINLVTNVYLIQKLVSMRSSFFNKVSFALAKFNFLVFKTIKTFVGFGGMHNRNTNSKFINNYLVLKLGQYFVIQEILKPVLFDLKVAYSVLAFFICIAGRLTRKERASYAVKQHGNVTFGTKDCSLDANNAFKILRFGLTGLKTVINSAIEHVKPVAYKINTVISNNIKSIIRPKLITRTYYTTNNCYKVKIKNEFLFKRVQFLFLTKRFMRRTTSPNKQQLESISQQPELKNTTTAITNTLSNNNNSVSVNKSTINTPKTNVTMVNENPAKISHLSLQKKYETESTLLTPKPNITFTQTIINESSYVATKQHDFLNIPKKEKLKSLEPVAPKILSLKEHIENIKNQNKEYFQNVENEFLNNIKKTTIFFSDNSNFELLYEKALTEITIQKSTATNAFLIELPDLNIQNRISQEMMPLALSLIELNIHDKIMDPRKFAICANNVIFQLVKFIYFPENDKSDFISSRLNIVEQIFFKYEPFVKKFKSLDDWKQWILEKSLLIPTAKQDLSYITNNDLKKDLLDSITVIKNPPLLMEIHETLKYAQISTEPCILPDGSIIQIIKINGKVLFSAKRCEDLGMFYGLQADPDSILAYLRNKQIIKILPLDMKTNVYLINGHRLKRRFLSGANIELTEIVTQAEINYTLVKNLQINDLISLQTCTQMLQDLSIIKQTKNLNTGIQLHNQFFVNYFEFCDKHEIPVSVVTQPLLKTHFEESPFYDIYNGLRQSLFNKIVAKNSEQKLTVAASFENFAILNNMYKNVLKLLGIGI